MRTEEVNPRTVGISEAETAQILSMINTEDASVPAIVAESVPQIAELVDRAVLTIQSGGRIVYCGCGTSGRLAVADAAECPPTYGLSPNMISAVIAGGIGAVVNAAEGCEDSIERGIEAFKQADIKDCDMVIGISASGKAPFVLAFMEEAHKTGCVVGAIVNNPDTPMAYAADISVVACTGAEVIKGSTRMKAGTAQKLILNMFSTAVCIRIGCTYRNYMVNMKVSNSKLKYRAIGMVMEITGMDAKTAETCLQAADWSVKKVLQQYG